MTTATPTLNQNSDARVRPLAADTAVALRALMLRDLAVLRANLGGFLARTVLQPLLLVFVFTYVFPQIGQDVGGEQGAGFSGILIAGVVANTVLFQGVLSVSVPLVNDFGHTREIEDRVLAPVPVTLIAVGKIVAGALECLLAGLVVFPIAAVIPAAPIPFDISWPVLLTIVPLACVMSGAMGLMFGTMFEPHTVPVLFGVILVPVTFLGCIYYTWTDLHAIAWLQIGSLVNPLVYLSEGMRAALTPVSHMSLVGVYAALTAFTALFTWRGIHRFTTRVIT
jgi:ABC-2 type transport system permease protein